MQVFKPRGNHGRTFVVQNLDMIAVQGENLLQKLHVGGENVGRENGVFALHFRGEIYVHTLFCLLKCRKTGKCTGLCRKMVFWVFFVS